jgi:hypothetical protein
MANIKLNQQLHRVEIKEFEISNQIVFNYFNNLSTNERDEKLLKAIYIGVLALMEDRFSTFLSKTTNELGTELESLKMVFEMKNELFYKSTIKGILAEDDIVEFLNQYFENRKLKDKAYLTGNTIGNLTKNKTGDIICEVNGNPELKIAIECKFDKSVRLGDIESKDIFIRKSDTAWSQLLEAQANRNSKVSLIVFDLSLVENSILKNIDGVGYIAGVGFIAIINSQKGDYSNLAIAYMLARDIALNAKVMKIDNNILKMIVRRIIKDINEVLIIKSLIQSNIENNKAILKQLEKSLLLLEFNQEYLRRFLNQGTLTKQDLLDFYTGEDIKDKFRLIEKELNEI